jgi:excisionase family DNA binding protein
MTPVLLEEAEELHKALASKSSRIDVSFSRSTAEFIAEVIDAKVQGKDVVITRGHQEMTPTEAAAILGISRPQVRKIMDSGKLPYRMVGTHHRISISDLRQYQEEEQARQEAAMKRFTELENKLGLFKMAGLSK